MSARFGPRSRVIQLLIEDKRYERARLLSCSLMLQAHPDFRGTTEELIRRFFDEYCKADWYTLWSYLNDAAESHTGFESIAAMVELRRRMGLPAFRSFVTSETH